MTDATIQYSLRQGVGHIVLNRPAKRNALSLAMRTALWDAVDRADQDDAVRAVLLSGAGEHFCAGGDIGEMRPGALDAEAGRDRIAPVTKGARRLLETTKPVVVAVDGCAYGAGCSLALAADFVVATERASFCMSFLRLGLVPDACGLFTLPRVVGWLRAKDMLYSTRAIGGAEAWSRPGGAGQTFVVDGIRVGTLICADAWPPEPAAQLAAAGAQILLAPANWPPLAGMEPGDIWERRARQTGLPLVVVNRGGKEPELDFSQGESAVASDGRRLFTFTAAEGGIFYVDWDRHRRFRSVHTD